MLNLIPLTAFNDNYIWLLQQPQSNCCAVVDPGDAQPVLDWLQANEQWQLTDILLTHHHGDHTGGVAQIKQLTGARVIGPALENIADLDIKAQDGQQLEVLGQQVQVLHVPGHTLGHLAFYLPGAPGLLFSGDTLFAAGCGRMFEGTAEQMSASLARLAKLPADTKVYCAHEYTLSNLKFATAVEPDNQDIEQRLQEVTQLRANNAISLPTSLELELKTNPFLRTHLPSVQNSLQTQGLIAEQASPAELFAALRGWKDNF